MSQSDYKSHLPTTTAKTKWRALDPYSHFSTSCNTACNQRQYYNQHYWSDYSERYEMEIYRSLSSVRVCSESQNQHKNLRKWRHQEAEDGQEAQVDAGHISGILGTFPKALPNPFGPIRTQRSEVFWSSPSKGGACEDSVCGHCSSSWPTPL